MKFVCVMCEWDFHTAYMYSDDGDEMRVKSAFSARSTRWSVRFVLTCASLSHIHSGTLSDDGCPCVNIEIVNFVISQHCGRETHRSICVLLGIVNS